MGIFITRWRVPGGMTALREIAARFEAATHLELVTEEVIEQGVVVEAVIGCPELKAGVRVYINSEREGWMSVEYLDFPPNVYAAFHFDAALRSLGGEADPAMTDEWLAAARRDGYEKPYSSFSRLRRFLVRHSMMGW